MQINNIYYDNYDSYDDKRMDISDNNDTLHCTCRKNLVYYKKNVLAFCSLLMEYGKLAIDIVQNIFYYFQLQWRNNECNGVSNRRPIDYLLYRLFRYRSKKTPKLCVTGLW